MPSRSLHNTTPYWKKRRRRITGTGWHREVADDIWERDNGTCIYCGGHGEVIDHVIPRSLGGSSSCSNGVVACTRCNMAKSKRAGNEAQFMVYVTRGLFYLASKGEQIPYSGKVRELPATYEAKSAPSEILRQQLSVEGLETEAGEARCNDVGRITLTDTHNTYQVYRINTDIQKGLMQCVLMFIERYSVLPTEIRLHASYQDKGLSLPDEVGSPKFVYEPNVMQAEVWVGMIPEEASGDEV